MSIPNPIDTVDTDPYGGRRFLHELFRDADAGYIGLTPIGAAGALRSEFVASDKTDELYDRCMAHDGRVNVYVRLTTTRAIPEKRGGAADTMHGFALPIDLDPGDGWNVQLVNELLAALVAAGLAPTVLIFSGGGWHAYLFLDEALEHVEHGELLGRMKATMIRLAREIGQRHGIELTVDPKVYDSARVMRVPGTVNVKRGDARCVVLEADYDRRYSWTQLDDLLDRPTLRIEHRVLAGAAEMPAGTKTDDDAPGMQFNAENDGADVFLKLFPGFDITHVDSDGNLYIRRPDRRTHGIVRYADDGHIAIYSATTLREQLRIPAGSPDDRDGPWWPFNLYTYAAHGGDFAKASKALAGGEYDGRKYGASARNAEKTAADIAWLAEGLTGSTAPQLTVVDGGGQTTDTPPPDLDVIDGGDMLSQLEAMQAEHNRQSDDDEPAAATDTTAGPQQPATMPDDLDVDPVRLLGLLGCVEAQTLGDITHYGHPLLGGGTTIVATVNRGVVSLLDPIRHLKPALADERIGRALSWVELADIILDGQLAAGMRRILDENDTLDGAPLLKRLRAVIGGNAKPAWRLAAASKPRKPQPKPTILQVAPGKFLLYPNSHNTIYGPSGTGKTWLLALIALDCIRRLGRPVLWLDFEEPDNSQGRWRLEALGATEAELDMLIEFGEPGDEDDDEPFPSLFSKEYGEVVVNDKAAVELAKFVQRENIAAVLIDSFSELAGSQDLDDNNKRDVIRIRKALTKRLARHSAVVMVDHVGNTNNGREAGSVNKKNGLDGARIYVEQIAEITGSQLGSSRLWITKDRRDSVKAWCVPGQIQLPGKVTIDAHCAGVLTFVPATLNGGTASCEIIPPTPATMPTIVGVSARAEQPKPGEPKGRGTSTEDVLVEMLVRGDFTSLREAHTRLKARHGIGKDLADSLMQQLKNDGLIVAGERSARGASTGFNVVLAKVPKTVHEAARIEAKRNAESSSECAAE